MGIQPDTGSAFTCAITTAPDSQQAAKVLSGATPIT
jgi:hypothetical protein